MFGLNMKTAMPERPELRKLIRFASNIRAPFLLGSTFGSTKFIPEDLYIHCHEACMTYILCF